MSIVYRANPMKQTGICSAPPQLQNPCHKDQVYWNAAACDDTNGITLATNGTQEVGLPVGTVAFGMAANTSHLRSVVGQAMKSRAPRPVKCQTPPV